VSTAYEPPQKALNAAATALDPFATEPYGDLRLNAHRAASLAVLAAAPHIQRDALSRLGSFKPVLGMVVTALVTITLVTAALAIAAIQLDGWAQALAAVAGALYLVTTFWAKAWRRLLQSRAGRAAREASDA
jgi:hypothetical protein